MDLSLLGMLSAAGGGSSSSKKADGNPVVLDGLQGDVPFNSVTLSGKNLLDISQYSDRNINGIEVKILGSSEIICNGICTGTSPYPTVKYKKIKANVGDKLTATAVIKSGNFTSADGNRSLLMFVSLTGVESTSGFNAIVAPNRIISAGYSDSATFTVSSGMLADDGTLNLAVQCRFLNGDVADNLIIGWQLEYGDTATPYEPPITGRELTVGVCGKNLIPYPYTETTKTVNGITFTDNGDGTIAVDGTASSDAVFYFANKKDFIPSGNSFYLSGCPVGGSGLSYDIVFVTFDENNTTIDVYNDVGNRKHITVSGNAKTTSVYIRIRSGQTISNLIFRPQLELGDTVTKFEPYHGAEYTITPDSNPYTVPVDIIQQDGINVLSIADDSNPNISVSGNKASEQLGTIYRTLNNKPVLLFDGNIPTSSSAGYAEFTIDKEYSALIIVPICNESSVYEPGACTVIPIGYITEEEQGFTVYGYPRATQRVSRPFIKRIGNTIYVRSSNTSFDRMIIYRI